MGETRRPAIRCRAGDGIAWRINRDGANNMNPFRRAGLNAGTEQVDWITLDSAMSKNDSVDWIKSGEHDPGINVRPTQLARIRRSFLRSLAETEREHTAQCLLLLQCADDHRNSLTARDIERERSRPWTLQ
jgi:hypothetical protein